MRVVVLPAVPHDALGLDAAFGETAVSALAQRRRLTATEQLHPLGKFGNVVALGADRALVALHLLERPAGALGDLLERHAAANEALHVARTQRVLLLGLAVGAGRLTTIAPDRRAQLVGDGEGEAPAVTVGEQEVRPVFRDPHQTQFLHDELHP